MIIDKLNDLILNFYIKAHSWYSAACCSDKDCDPVPCDAIVETEKGYTYMGKVFKNVYPSQDNQCHACIHDTLGNLCLYIQMNS